MSLGTVGNVFPYTLPSTPVHRLYQYCHGLQEEVGEIRTLSMWFAILILRGQIGVDVDPCAPGNIVAYFPKRQFLRFRGAYQKGTTRTINLALIHGPQLYPESCSFMRYLWLINKS